jgi:hypothetical protein
MQTLNSADEVEASPTFMLRSSPKKKVNRRQSTLGVVTLRTKSKKVCVNWSIIPTNCSSKKVKDLISLLEQKVNECLDQPIEILEDKLFYLCYIYYNELNGISPNPQVIELFHLVSVVQEECTKNQKVSNALLELGKISENYMKSYEFLCNFVKLINDLSLIYGIINFYNYRFRFEPDIEKLKILNLKNLFSDIINMEIIWLSFVVSKPPLKHVLSQEVKELAKILQKEFYKTLDIFMESNADNLQNKESIQSWLASKNLHLVEDYGFHYESINHKPTYQNLAQKIFNCFCFKTAFQATELKNQLCEFEKIYRHFEAVILKSWYELERFNN